MEDCSLLCNNVEDECTYVVGTNTTLVPFCENDDGDDDDDDDGGVGISIEELGPVNLSRLSDVELVKVVEGVDEILLVEEVPFHPSVF